jgi:hypothetical protein
LIKLKSITTGWAGGKMDLVLDASGDDSNFHGSNKKPTELGADIKSALLCDDEKITVGRVEC